MENQGLEQLKDLNIQINKKDIRIKGKVSFSQKGFFNKLFLLKEINRIFKKNIIFFYFFFI